MKKPFKCEYCEAKPNTVHMDELLCNRHYDALYGNKLIKGYQFIDVPKTAEEKILSEKYITILNTHNFVNERKTKKIVKEFLRDAKNIAISNSIYFQHN